VNSKAVPSPPNHLSSKSKTLWRQLVGKRVRSPGRVILFQVALEALDRADQAQKLLEEEGLVRKTESTGALHAHPLIKVERDCRTQFSKIWKDLSLGWDASTDGRLS